MKLKKIFACSILFASSLLISACGSGSDNEEEASSSSSQQTSTSSSVDLSKVDLPQLETEVQANEAAVEMVTSKGTIKIKLFPEYAPKAVENFMTHAHDGYYNGMKFHRIIKDFMIQSGDPNGDGTGGESIWGEAFEMELNKNLYNLRGALAMARSSNPVSQGSQFYIVQNGEDMSQTLSKDDYPEKIIEAYKSGGAPHLDGNYTVFGQVYEGMDVVDAIADVEVKASEEGGEASTPTEDITIESVKVIQEAKGTQATTDSTN